MKNRYDEDGFKCECDVCEYCPVRRRNPGVCVTCRTVHRERDTTPKTDDDQEFGYAQRWKPFL